MASEYEEHNVNSKVANAVADVLRVVNSEPDLSKSLPAMMKTKAGKEALDVVHAVLKDRASPDRGAISVLTDTFPGFQASLNKARMEQMKIDTSVAQTGGPKRPSSASSDSTVGSVPSTPKHR